MITERITAKSGAKPTLNSGYTWVRTLRRSMLLAIGACCWPAFAEANGWPLEPIQIRGQLELRGAYADSPEPWLYQGSGLHRYESGGSLNLGTSVIDIQQNFLSSWSLHGVLHANDDDDIKLGFTEAYLRYKPLTAGGLAWQVKLGGFYPAMSLENPAPGWVSPYLYSNSAINSWVGEELRTVGGELTLSRSGRQFQSPHSVAAVVSVFKANDPAGSLLAWRGFALHDRQSLFNESIPFAENPAFDDPRLSKQANEVQPFTEVDGRYGYYLGAHWDYYKRSQVRLYYYDNNGDPAAINYQAGQYAWDTRFVSTAWLYKFSPATRLIVQAMYGSTAMGRNRGVNNDYLAWFALLSHKVGKHRISLRYDDYTVKDKDHWAFDPNDSDGQSVALAWRYQAAERWQLGSEVMYTESYAANRALWWEDVNARQTQWQLNVSYQF